jgi:hypothetical protein
MDSTEEVIVVQAAEALTAEIAGEIRDVLMGMILKDDRGPKANHKVVRHVKFVGFNGGVQARGAML